MVADTSICGKLPIQPTGNNKTCFMAYNDTSSVFGYSDTMTNFQNQVQNEYSLSVVSPQFSTALQHCIYPTQVTQTGLPVVGYTSLKTAYAVPPPW
jgi:hypothetical protein